MSARDVAVTVSGPGVDRGFPGFGVALSFAVTCASRTEVDSSFYVRDADGVLLGRTDRVGAEVAVWRFDPLPGDVRERQLAAANARLEEAGSAVGSDVNERRFVMAARTSSGAKKSTARKATGRRSRSSSPAARKTDASRSPADATARRPVLAAGEKAGRVVERKPTAALAVAISLLKKHDGGEMKVSELAAAVVASGKVDLKGKTPAATVGAQIYTAAKAGRWFRKTQRGHVALLEAPASS